MKQTSYEIGADYAALVKLVNDTFIDPETEEAREPTQEEKDYLQKCFMEIKENAETKFDNIGKFIRNVEFEADLISAEKEVFYREAERLRKSVQAHENKVKGLRNVAFYLLDKLDMKKIKTPLFSFNIQATKKSVKPVQGFFNADDIPTEYLKRELFATAINEAIKEGKLYEKEGELNRTKLFYRDESGEQVLKGVAYTGGETLVIR
jgi:hypothetical protein